MKKQSLCLLLMLGSLTPAIAGAQTRFGTETSVAKVCKTADRNSLVRFGVESSSGERVRLLPAFGKPVLKVNVEGVTLFEYESGLLAREYGPQKTGTYVYDRYGRFDRLEYSDGTIVLATYGKNDQLTALSTPADSAVSFAYAADNPIVAVTPALNAYEFHTALTLVSNPCAALSTKLPSGFTSHAVDPPTPEGTPIVTVQGTRDGPSGVDYVPIGGPGRGGGGAGGPKPQPHPWNKNPKPEYPPDTFTEDYPPFDLPPDKCKDWCMRSDSVAHGMCALIKRPDRRAICHQQINGFTSNCLRSCTTGDWGWLKD